MQWSRLRSSVRALICPELRRRVDFHVTSYRHRSSRIRSGVVTVDGQRVLSLSYDRFCREGDGWFASVRQEGGGPSYKEWEWSPLQTDEIHPPQQLGDAMRAYLAMPHRSALESGNPFLRALAIVDRRMGRRTLDELKIGEGEHSLVKEFYRLRMSLQPLRQSPL
jgi:hypothetical protein